MEIFREQIESNGQVCILAKNELAFSIKTPGGEAIGRVSRKLTRRLVSFSPARFSSEEDVLNVICATIDCKSRLESCRIGDTRIFIRNFQKLEMPKLKEMYVYQMKVRVDVKDNGEICFLQVFTENLFNVCVGSD